MSCQAHRNVATQRRLTMRASKEKTEVHMFTRAYATRPRALVCVRVCLCGARAVWSTHFLHAVGTLNVQLARPAAPHPPTLRRACVLPGAASVPPPLVPPAHRVGSDAQGSRSLTASRSFPSSPETPCWEANNYKKKANNAWNPQWREGNIRVNLHA